MRKPPQVSEVSLEASLDNLLHTPALKSAQRPALLDEDSVTCSAIVPVIVGLVALSALDELFVNWVTHATGDLDHDGLVIFIASDQPD